MKSLYLTVALYLVHIPIAESSHGTVRNISEKDFARLTLIKTK